MAEKVKSGEVPKWLVTFADLMSLLVCFFVLIISFSIQDKEKLQVVAGSVREAFGVQVESRKAGFIEFEGVPIREYIKEVSQVETDHDTSFETVDHDEHRKQGHEVVTHQIQVSEVESSKKFAAAAASLRQAWQSLPEITEVSSQILLEETPEGLNIQLVDQDGRSMFAKGAVQPYEYTRKILLQMAPVLTAMPNRIQVTGHTDATDTTNPAIASSWDLTASRANVVRKILAEGGIKHDRFFSVVGKADTDPLFPDNPFLAANRRVSILLMNEEPPVPEDLQP